MTIFSEWRLLYTLIWYTWALSMKIHCYSNDYYLWAVNYSVASFIEFTSQLVMLCVLFTVTVLFGMSASHWLTKRDFHFENGSFDSLLHLFIYLFFLWNISRTQFKFKFKSKLNGEHYMCDVVLHFVSEFH